MLQLNSSFIFMQLFIQNQARLKVDDHLNEKSALYVKARSCNSIFDGRNNTQEENLLYLKVLVLDPLKQLNCIFTIILK